MTYSLILATAAEKTKLEVLADGIVGIFIVIFILLVVTGLISALSLLFKEKPVTPTAAPAGNNTVAQAQPAQAPATTGISDAHLRVIIAAAIKVSLPTSSRPPHLQLAAADTTWANEGRRTIFQSHRPR
ncbi:MAG: hypothetical protein LBS59_05625 [Puniceicoccales bacterium]|jgi:Na+-transporting methylmalonyl-CoA/oxaloacetate decarboxylase gamma subunit|nr:hypothetical protein [Puniceicoccales bacterium]